MNVTRKDLKAAAELYPIGTRIKKTGITRKYLYGTVIDAKSKRGAYMKYKSAFTTIAKGNIFIAIEWDHNAGNHGSMFYKDSNVLEIIKPEEEAAYTMLPDGSWGYMTEGNLAKAESNEEWQLDLREHFEVDPGEPPF